MNIFRGFFLLWTILEIVAFCLVVAWLGFFSAIGLIILSFIIGVMVMRSQGLELLRKAQYATAHGQTPPADMLEHLSILIGGFFLMIPGFIASLFGLLLIIPHLRHAPMRWLMAHGILNLYRPVRPVDPVDVKASPGRVIDGESWREDDSTP